MQGRWHSQVGQDRTIALLFHGKRDGYFVDLAANDPIYLSNTRSLERDFGWTGLCIDGNQQMLDRLVAERSCRVIKAVVTGSADRLVEFTAPLNQGTWEDGLGGIMSNRTDNKAVRPGFAKQEWRATRHTTTTLGAILEHVRAPVTIDYLSLDIEGSEYDALSTFDFGKHTFLSMTIERPSASLRKLLRSKYYRHVKDHGCFGDQVRAWGGARMWLRRRSGAPDPE